VSATQAKLVAAAALALAAWLFRDRIAAAAVGDVELGVPTVNGTYGGYYLTPHVDANSDGSVSRGELATDPTMAALIGINDVINGIDPAVSEANCRSIMTQIRAWSPTVPVAWISLLLFGGELWAAGPPLSWGPNPPFLKDPAIDAFNVMLQSVCVDFDCTYIDMRSQLLAWESQNNTPEPGVQIGPFANGGPHPLAPSGQILMGEWGIGSFEVIP
jgi:hypothetical protein